MDTNSLRVKQIRQKDSNNNFISYPIGVEGNFVDLLSNLNLEEELKIGGNHYVEIEDGQDYLVIKEYYSKLPHNLPNWVSSITHTVIITMDEGNTFLIDNTYDNQHFAINNNEDGVLIISKEESTSTNIVMKLYEGVKALNGVDDTGVFLHQKNIVISSSVNDSGYTNYIIDEAESEVQS